MKISEMFRPFFLTAVCFAVGLSLGACPKKTPIPEEIKPAAVSLSSITPSTVTEGKTVQVQILGQGFQEGAIVRFGREDAKDVKVESSSKIRATVPSSLFPGIYDVNVRNPDDGKASLPLALTVEASKPVTVGPAIEVGTGCKLVTIFFEYDEAGLSPAARDQLKNNADCMRSKGTGSVRLEGHADERGSTEYNLALGQRRAESVRKYLVGLGISPDALSTLTYGEEKPALTGNGETVWSQNRRVEFVVR